MHSCIHPILPNPNHSDSLPCYMQGVAVYLAYTEFDGTFWELMHSMLRSSTFWFWLVREVATVFIGLRVLGQAIFASLTRELLNTPDSGVINDGAATGQPSRAPNRAPPTDGRPADSQPLLAPV